MNHKIKLQVKTFGAAAKYEFKITNKSLLKYKNGIYGVVIDWTATKDMIKFKFPKGFNSDFGSEGPGGFVFFGDDIYNRKNQVGISILIRGLGDSYKYFRHYDTKYGIVAYFIPIDFEEGAEVLS